MISIMSELNEKMTEAWKKSERARKTKTFMLTYQYILDGFSFVVCNDDYEF